jgi:cycloeucalenol cycloisomerase
MSQLIALFINNEMDIVVQMTMILGTSLAGIVGLIALQQPRVRTTTSDTATSSFLPNPIIEPSKYAYEVFVALYTPIWIFIFGCIVVTQYYEKLSPTGYIMVCTVLALPFLLQPIILPGGVMILLRGNNDTASLHRISPDQNRPLLERYAFKANVWIATYSFIGNYWYTHYFYSVLQASYTMPNAIRFNNVPIQMYCATHFYFTTYHLFSNCLLRKVCTTYQPTWIRHVLFVAVILVFSYFTAFMETLTISSYPYYTFKDRHVAYTVGSAFYGIYFLVSFPAFYFFDRHIDSAAAQASSIHTDVPLSSPQPHQNIVTAKSGKPISLGETIVQSCGFGMIILFLLDFVRLWLDIPLIVGHLNK